MLRGGEGLQEEKHGGEARGALKALERNTKHDAVNSVSTCGEHVVMSSDDSYPLSYC